MKIGELARVTGTPVETIRYYEREGLLAAPARTDGNFRIYEDTHAERLSFIRHCRSLDMSLDEIRILLRFKDAPGANCGDVNTLLDAHIVQRRGTYPRTACAGAATQEPARTMSPGTGCCPLWHPARVVTARVSGSTYQWRARAWRARRRPKMNDIQPRAARYA